MQTTSDNSKTRPGIHTMIRRTSVNKTTRFVYSLFQKSIRRSIMNIDKTHFLLLKRISLSLLLLSLSGMSTASPFESAGFQQNEMLLLAANDSKEQHQNNANIEQELRQLHKQGKVKQDYKLWEKAVKKLAVGIQNRGYGSHTMTFGRNSLWVLSFLYNGVMQFPIWTKFPAFQEIWQSEAYGFAPKQSPEEIYAGILAAYATKGLKVKTIAEAWTTDSKNYNTVVRAVKPKDIHYKKYLTALGKNLQSTTVINLALSTQNYNLIKLFGYKHAKVYQLNTLGITIHYTKQK